MKKTKAEPSLAGLLLIVTGMLLISVVVLDLAGSSNLARSHGKVMLAVGCAALGSIVVGAALTGRKSK